MVQVMVVDNVSDPRADSRSNVFLTATLDSSSGVSPVRVRNISVGGALLEGRDLPSEGTGVRLRRGRLSAQGEVAWEFGNHRGIRFSSPIDVPDWVRRVEHLGQHQVDAIVGQLRAGTQLQVLAEAEGDTLRAVSSDLDRLCDLLAGLPQLPIEFEEQLVRLDTLAQRLRYLVSKNSTD